MNTFKKFTLQELFFGGEYEFDIPIPGLEEDPIKLKLNLPAGLRHGNIVESRIGIPRVGVVPVRINIIQDNGANLILENTTPKSYYLKWQLDGNDLIYTKKIDSLPSNLNSKISFKLDGIDDRPIHITLDKSVIFPMNLYKIEGQGFSDSENIEKRGDLFIRFV